MGTLGKILLFVNFLAAIGLAFLATQDWAQRQEVAATALRYQLVLSGLPVDAPKGGAESSEKEKDSVPFGAETSGMHVVKTVRPSLLKKHFEGSDGGQNFGAAGADAPGTQVDEVKRVQAKVTAQLSAAGSPAEKLALLCGRFTQQGYTPGWLASLAESYDERDLVRTMVFQQNLANAQTAEKNAADAETMLKKRFESVLSAPNAQLANEESEKLKTISAELRKASEQVKQANIRFQQEYARVRAAGQSDASYEGAVKDLNTATAGLRKANEDLKAQLTTLGSTACRDDSDRRKRIAHLLAHLDRDATWQKRVALVVGMRTYLATIQDHVNRLRDMATSAQQQIALDQAEFSEQYEVLKSLANERALLLERQIALTADLADQRTRDREAVNQRKAQFDRRQQDFQDLQTQVAAALTKQAEAENALFTVQKQVGDAMQRNFQLEDALGAAESKKVGGK